jgi:hypothetical protein
VLLLSEQQVLCTQTIKVNSEVQCG